MAKTVFRTTAKKDTNEAAAPAVFEAGEEIFAQDEPGEEMFIIQAGKVEVLRTAPDGTRRRLAVLDKGDFFGEMALLEDAPRTATVRAIEKTTCLRLRAATFNQMLHENPEIVVRMLRTMSKRLHRALLDLDEVSNARSVAIAPSSPAKAAKKAPGKHRLVTEDGSVEFRLSIGSETTVGRRDPITGTDPDVDLTPIDQHRSISRSHAKVYHRGSKFFVREELGTSNGTFINDERLETGVPAEIHDGDRVRFGLVKLVFRVEE
ncbi:MAG: cyclic nucleotide-binding domain-containing protein [Thermoanaerobaculia bacterium]|nr:cyclic nucleotide-binding domain-containing protein [Thermoanaerobaculia bacterium]